jgi:selenide,water dikinase
LRAIPRTADENLIVGMEKPDDAGVYRIAPDLALIQTLDFFTPIVDDPYDFGQITAANALSDVYAMGGRPLLAMNIICFPVGDMDISVLEDVLRGGSDKMAEAGVLLVGGHSVEDREIKYGLSVTGVVHPDRVLRNSGALPGDALVLTKPLGTGIVGTAVKAGLAGLREERIAVDAMKALNREAAAVMSGFDVHACTDVTGFGLLGHACEMVEGTDAGMMISASGVPLLDGALEYAAMGLIPGGAYRNRDFRSSMVDVDPAVLDDLVMVLFDPQTSGGLLLCVEAPRAGGLVGALHDAGVEKACVIGEVTGRHPGRVVVVP